MAHKKKFELNDNNLAIAYYRFSSHSQNEASIDQQRELAHAWADAHGFKIVKEYEDEIAARSKNQAEGGNAESGRNADAKDASDAKNGGAA